MTHSERTLTIPSSGPASPSFSSWPRPSSAGGLSSQPVSPPAFRGSWRPLSWPRPSSRRGLSSRPVSPPASRRIGAAAFATGASPISMSKMAPRSSVAIVGALLLAPSRGGGDRLFDQFQVIHAPEHEQQFRRRIEAIADPVHHRGHVLAHPRVVRATAPHLDLFRLREEPLLPIRHQSPSPLSTACLAAVRRACRSCPRIVLSAPASAASGSAAMSIWILYSSDPLTRALIRPFSIFRSHDRTVANVGPPARQAVLKVAVALQVRAPRLAPEGRGDGSALDVDRGDGLPLLDPLGDFPRGLGTPLGHGNVRLESVVASPWECPPSQ